MKMNFKTIGVKEVGAPCGYFLQVLYFFRAHHRHTLKQFLKDGQVLPYERERENNKIV